MAGQTPMRPSSGISIASNASDGTVCSMLTTPSTACPVRRRRAASIPSGTPTSVAAPTAPPGLQVAGGIGIVAMLRAGWGRRDSRIFSMRRRWCMSLPPLH